MGGIVLSIIAQPTEGHIGLERRLHGGSLPSPGNKTLVAVWQAISSCSWEVQTELTYLELKTQMLLALDMVENIGYLQGHAKG